MYSLLLTALLLACASAEEGHERHEPIASSPIHIHVEDHADGSPKLPIRLSNLPLNTLRDDVTKQWADELTKGSIRFYNIAKFCDGGGQFLMFLTPLFSCLATVLNSQPLGIVATAAGTGAVAIHRLGRYAANESSSRMEAFKKLCRQEGVQPPGVTIGDGSSNGSNGE